MTGSVNPVLHVRFKLELLTSELRFTVAERRLAAYPRPSFTRFLVVLWQAWIADQTESPRWRGYCTSAQIGAAYADTLDGLGPIDDGTVKAYASRINHLVAPAVERLERELDRPLEAPVLIESERLEGYRIGVHGLDVVGLPELEAR